MSCSFVISSIYISLSVSFTLCVVCSHVYMCTCKSGAHAVLPRTSIWDFFTCKISGKYRFHPLHFWLPLLLWKLYFQIVRGTSILSWNPLISIVVGLLVCMYTGVGVTSTAWFIICRVMCPWTYLSNRAVKWPLLLTQVAKLKPVKSSANVQMTSHLFLYTKERR